MPRLKNPTVSFRTFASFSDYLDQLGLFRMVPGHERITTVLDNLRLVDLPFALVQVVGTNGKGSTTTMLANLGREHGLTVGSHTSPHFVSVRERVRINNFQLSEGEWTQLANAVMVHGGELLSYFEFITCLSVLAFAEARVDLAVMETGLGGTFDATTALNADMVLYTPIDFDHQAVLGSTLKQIAADKAGAIRPDKIAMSVPQPSEAWRELAATAAKRNAALLTVPHNFPLPLQADGRPPEMALQGSFQYANARLALAAWRQIREDSLLSAKAVAKLPTALEPAAQGAIEAKALKTAWLPGRMQLVPSIAGHWYGYTPSDAGWPTLLLDGAHNCHGLAALGLSLARKSIGPAAIVFSCLEDKQPEAMAAHVRALGPAPIFIPPIENNPRAMPTAKLTKLIGMNATPASTFVEALESAAHLMAERLPEAFHARESNTPLLICGSLYMLGSFYKLRPDCLDPVE